MSDDEEMSQQVMTQNTTQSGCSMGLSSSFGNIESDTVLPPPWGIVNIYKIASKRLGLRGPIGEYVKTKIFSQELVTDSMTFGRKADCNLIRYLSETKLSDLSNVHFTISKNDPSDALSPVFLEDKSKNGTYFHAYRSKANGFGTGHLKRVDEKCKRCILAHKDVFYIERKPTISFEYLALQPIENDLPDDINHEYHIGKVLGNGACGTVYFVQNRRTCQTYALKYTTDERNDRNIMTILKEVEILQQLQHPCILKLFKTQTYTDSVAIFIDFMKGGDLFNRLTKYGYFSESYTKFLIYQICLGLQYLHQRNVTHRDLKPDNILLATTDRYTLVKVSDFGLSKRVTTSNLFMKTQCGTLGYLAPEVSTSNYTDKVDVWSLGVVIFNCLTGGYPYHPNSTEFNMKFGNEKFKKISTAGQDIVFETLQKNADHRPSITELLMQRQWLSQSDKSVQKAIEVINSIT